MKAWWRWFGSGESRKIDFSLHHLHIQFDCGFLPPGSRVLSAYPKRPNLQKSIPRTLRISRQVVPPNWYVATMTKVKRENRKLFSKVSIVLIIALPLHFPHFLCPIQLGAAMAVAAGNWGRRGGVAVVEPESRHNTSSNTIRSSLKCILSFCCESDDAEVG